LQGIHDRKFNPNELFILLLQGRGKVKESHYRLGQTLRVPYEGGKVVSPMHWPPLPPRKYSWYSFLLEAESSSGP